MGHSHGLRRQTLQLLLAGGLSWLLTLSALACYPEFMPLNAVLEGLNGGSLNTSELKNQMVVFQFVSLQCRTCKKDMEKVGEAARHYHVRYIPVSVDKKISWGRKFFRDNSYSNHAYFDKNKVAKLFGVHERGVIVVNVKGEIVAANVNEMREEDLKTLNNVLENPNFPERSLSSK